MWRFKKQKGLKEHQIFEKLVLDYLNSHFPFANWKDTGFTRDENRDAEATFLFSGEKIWAEAKFKYDDTKKLASRKYDSTLVSAILNENVVKIYFVSNTIFNPELINRVSEFCFICDISNIVFIDKNVLESWISSNKTIQKKYFINWNQEPIKQKIITLKEIKILYKRDSFFAETINTINYSLYSFHCYKFQIEIKILGFANITNNLTIYCNNQIIFEDKYITDGIYTFDITKIVQNNISRNIKSFIIEIKYKIGNTEIIIGEEKLYFKNPDRLSCSQQKQLNKAEKYINDQQRFLISGNVFVGKSEVLARLKSVSLAQSKPNQRIFYINFKGSPNDIIYIVKLLLITIYDFYEDIEYNNLLERMLELNINIDFVNDLKLKDLLYFLKNNNSSQLIEIMKGILNKTFHYYFYNSKSTDRHCIFFIDNIDILLYENKKILISILNSISPFSGITIFYTCRNNNLPFDKEFKIDEVYLYEIENLLKKYNLYFSEKETKRIFQMCKYPIIFNKLEKEIEQSPSTKTLHNFFKRLTFIDKYPLINFTDELLKSIYFITLFNDGVNIETFNNLFNISIYQLIDTHYIYTEDNCLFSKICHYDIDFILSKIEKKKVLKYIEIEKEKMVLYLGILIKLDYKYIIDKTNIIIKNLKKLYWNSQYFEILYYYKDVCKYYYSNSSDSIMIKYYYVMACMNCGDNLAVNDIFCSVDLDEISPCKEYFLFASEKIDYDYWQWNNLNDLISNSLNYCKQMNDFYKNKVYLQDWEIKRAYLTLNNRIMVTYLLFDDFENAKKYLFINISLANLFQSQEHIGYCLMDFAKGIYNKNLFLAKKLLLLALKFFSTSKDLRRKLDCECELHYIRVLLKEKKVETFKEKYDLLKKNHYWNQYYKALLKECELYILLNNYEKATYSYTYFESINTFEKSPRNMYIMNLISKKLTNKYENIEVNKLPSKSFYTKTYYEIVNDKAYSDLRIW